MRTLTIGEIARQAAVAIETVRFYERRGLIVQPPKQMVLSASGTISRSCCLRIVRFMGGSDLAANVRCPDVTKARR